MIIGVISTLLNFQSVLISPDRLILKRPIKTFLVPVVANKYQSIAIRTLYMGDEEYSTF